MVKHHINMKKDKFLMRKIKIQRFAHFIEIIIKNLSPNIIYFLHLAQNIKIKLKAV